MTTCCPETFKCWCCFDIEMFKGNPKTREPKLEVLSRTFLLQLNGSKDFLLNSVSKSSLKNKIFYIWKRWFRILDFSFAGQHSFTAWKWYTVITIYSSLRNLHELLAFRTHASPLKTPLKNPAYSPQYTVKAESWDPTIMVFVAMRKIKIQFFLQA